MLKLNSEGALAQFAAPLQEQVQYSSGNLKGRSSVCSPLTRAGTLCRLIVEEMLGTICSSLTRANTARRLTVEKMQGTLCRLAAKAGAGI